MPDVWLVSVLVCVLLLLTAALATSTRIVQQFERGVVFRFGRVLPAVRRPGLRMIVPVVDRLHKVNMQTVAMGVPPQDGITRDNVSVRVDAVVYFRVIDPVKAIVNVQHYYYAVSQVAQTSLRSVIGHAELDQLLSERDVVNRRLREIIDQPTEGPWGVLVERVEVKDVSLPEGMRRSMSRQAEAERERRARIITADGEYQASKRLGAAAHVLASDPASLQLRLLQTVVDVAAEKNSTLIMPLPVEMLRFFDTMSGGSAGTQGQHQDQGEEGTAASTEEDLPDLDEQLDEERIPGLTEVPSPPPAAPIDEGTVQGERQVDSAAGE